VRLRDVELGDVDAYVRMRCDPAMTAELGGPLPREGIEAKVARDVQEAAAGTAWIKMIIPDEAVPTVVAGSVALWSHEDSEPISEIDWMVLPEFQGRGIGKMAVRACFSWSATTAAGDWCTRSRPPPTAPPTASAVQSASDSQVSKT
jgi:RimJ/RimL family protein N-acetyltransferase